jgi:hypothetical protein
MDRFEQILDLIGITIALLAVLLSVATVQTQRAQQRHHAFQQIHETLMTPEHQRGRWMLWEIAGSGVFPPTESDEFYLINRTLGTLDNLSLYVQRGVVPRQWVVDVWHHPLQAMEEAVLTLMEQRAAALGWRPWPYLSWFLAEVHGYRSPDLPCCLAAQPRPPAAPPAS